MDSKRTISLFAILAIMLSLFGCVGQSANRANIISTAGPTAPACGSIITGNLTLTADMDCNGTAIVIGADSVTLDCAGHSITGTGSGSTNGIDNTAGHSYSTVKYCNIAGFGNGIDFAWASHGTIANNTASNNSQYGIVLTNSSGNTIADNTAFNNNKGIWITIGSDDNILTGNNASSNIYGIWVCSDSDNNTLANNTARNNSIAGIWVGNATFNTLTGNILIGNKVGIGGCSSNNTIYNNFLNNTNNVQKPSSSPNANSWNIALTTGTNIIGTQGIGGNFWSGFSDTQNCTPSSYPYNGTCSSQYSIPGSNGGVDHHPLTYK